MLKVYNDIHDIIYNDIHDIHFSIFALIHSTEHHCKVNVENV